MSCLLLQPLVDRVQRLGLSGLNRTGPSVDPPPITGRALELQATPQHETAHLFTLPSSVPRPIPSSDAIASNRDTPVSVASQTTGAPRRGYRRSWSCVRAASRPASGSRVVGCGGGRFTGHTDVRTSRYAPLDFSNGPGEVSGLLTFIGLVLLVYGHSNERLRRRTPTRSRPVGFGSGHGPSGTMWRTNSRAAPSALSCRDPLVRAGLRECVIPAIRSHGVASSTCETPRKRSGANSRSRRSGIACALPLGRSRPR